MFTLLNALSLFIYRVTGIKCEAMIIPCMAEVFILDTRDRTARGILKGLDREKE